MCIHARHDKTWSGQAYTLYIRQTCRLCRRQLSADSLRTPSVTQDTLLGVFILLDMVHVTSFILQTLLDAYLLAGLGAAGSPRAEDLTTAHRLLACIT